MNATETYQARRQEIAQQLAKLQQQLERMDREQAADPQNWGFAGSAGHISSELDQFLDFVSDN